MNKLSYFSFISTFRNIFA